MNTHLAYQTAVFTNTGGKLKPLGEYLITENFYEKSKNDIPDELANKILRSKLKEFGGSLPKMTWEEFQKQNPR